MAGHVVSPARATWLCVEGQWTWYRRNWRATVISSFLQPVLFLVALGLGFGSQVQPGELTGGVRYVVFLAPALVVITAVQNAGFESTYAVLSQFKWQRTYIGVASTPITPAQVLYGQLTWVTLRLVSGSVVFLVIATALGAVKSFGVLLAVPFAALAGLAVCAPIVAYTATLDKPDSFNALFRFWIMPMTLFTGAFFPVSQLPDWLEPLVWVTPVWHGIELARNASFGTLELLPAVGHVLFLLVWIAVGTVLARRFFIRRLGV